MSTELTNGTPFDFASVALTRTDTGSPMPIRHPATGLPMLDEHKKPVTISFLGQYSDIFRETMRAIQVNRAEFHNEARAANPLKPAPLPQDKIDEENVTILTSCVVGWTIPSLDGQPFPFTPENAARLFTDRRFIWLRDPALAFIQGDGNFLSDSSSNSRDSPDTVSA